MCWLCSVVARCGWFCVSSRSGWRSRPPCSRSRLRSAGTPHGAVRKAPAQRERQREVSGLHATQGNRRRADDTRVVNERQVDS